MNNLTKSISVSLILLIAILPNKLNADVKNFGRSYTSYTLPANALEIEFWQTGRIDKGIGSYFRWQPRIEIEYGLTDRLTTSFYLNFNEVRSYDNQIQNKPLSLSTSSIEFRYRFSNPNEYFVDPALYFELSYGGDKIEYEPKILLSKRFNNFISVLNINSEFERNIAESENESSFEITMGLAYELSTNISLGLEFRNHRNYLDTFKKEENQASFIGPTVSYHSDRFYFVINFLAQLSGSPSTKDNFEFSSHEKYELRTILGIEL